MRLNEDTTRVFPTDGSCITINSLRGFDYQGVIFYLCCLIYADNRVSLYTDDPVFTLHWGSICGKPASSVTLTGVFLDNTNIWVGEEANAMKLTTSTSDGQYCVTSDN